MNGDNVKSKHEFQSYNFFFNCKRIKMCPGFKNNLKIHQKYKCIILYIFSHGGMEEWIVRIGGKKEFKNSNIKIQNSCSVLV